MKQSLTAFFLIFALLLSNCSTSALIYYGVPTIASVGYYSIKEIRNNNRPLEEKLISENPTLRDKGYNQLNELNKEERKKLIQPLNEKLNNKNSSINQQGLAIKALGK